MAYLNLRDKRLEAKIAYVGPALVGRSTNLDQLARAIPAAKLGKVESAEDDVLALSWQPKSGAPFPDCSVRVEVVAQKGAVSAEAFDDVMRDADGVVLVIDAQPSAAADNRAALVALKEVLARAHREAIPVVVQVNKTDLPDALAPSHVVDALDGATFRHVSAVAARGEGVVETLEAAIEAVLASFQTAGASPEPSTAAARPPPAGSATHPLLAALKEVLRDTVREHVAELEERLVARFSDAFDRIERRFATTETLTAKVGAEVAVLAKGADNTLLAVQLVDLLQETEAHVRDLEIAIGRAATKEDVDAVAGHFDKVREELKSDVARTLDTRSRADRDHLATATAALKKAIESSSADLAAGGASTAKHLVDLTTRIDALRPSIEQVGTVTKQRSGRIEEAVATLRNDVVTSAASEKERSAELTAKLTELTEELKKPKKSWFT